MLRADLHIHSLYSYDSVNKPADIVKRCLKKGISCIAVADHGTVEGALAVQKTAPFKVIPAEEIMTPEGEVMGLFLKNTIPSPIPLREALGLIREQGGLVCIPHPLDKPNRHGIGRNILQEIIDAVDIIEVFNSRSPLPSFSSGALAAAIQYSRACSAGSDAHTISEIGATYIDMPDFTGRDDFLQSLNQGRIHGRMTPFYLYPGSLLARARKLF